MEGEFPGNGGWAKDGEAEEPARVAGESAAGRKGTRRSEKAKVSEEALLTWSSKAKKPMNACVHTYTKSKTPSTRRRGPGWRIHGSVEDTKSSTNKQYSLSLHKSLLCLPQRCKVTSRLLTCFVNGMMDSAADISRLQRVRSRKVLSTLESLLSCIPQRCMPFCVMKLTFFVSLPLLAFYTTFFSL